MTSENNGSQGLPRLFSVPGLLSVAVFGVLVIVVSRLFGPQNLLREVVTELLASFGSTILLLAVFGLLFRSGLQRLLRGAPGGDTFARSTERLSELLQDFDQRGGETGGSREAEEKLDLIEKQIKALTNNEVPELREEIKGLREMLQGKNDQSQG